VVATSTGLDVWPNFATKLEDGFPRFVKCFN
jgi:hypothetical protein